MAIWLPNKMLPTYCRSSVSAFSHSLDTDPSAVGNLSQREQSEVKAAEFAYLCTQMCTHTRTSTDTQAQQCCVMWHRSLKKGCLESRRGSWLVGSEWVVETGNGQRMFLGCIHHAAPVLRLTHDSINYTINTGCSLQGKSAVILKEQFNILGNMFKDWRQAGNNF